MLLNEMPYIELNNGDIFDIELENYTKVEDFIEFLTNILNGKAIKDKYGTILQLKSQKDKLYFLNKIKSYFIYKKMKIKFTKNELDLLDLLFNI